MSQPLRDADAFTQLKQAELFVESDCVAIVIQNNTIMWMPVLIERSSGQCFILSDGKYLKAETVRGFEKYQLKVPTHAQAPAPADPPGQPNESRNFTEDYRSACRQRQAETFAALAERQQSRRTQSNASGNDPFQAMAAAERERISQGVRDRLKSRGRG